MPESINMLMEEANIDIVSITEDKLSEIRDKIVIEAANVVMVFPDNFAKSFTFCKFFENCNSLSIY